MDALVQEQKKAANKKRAATTEVASSPKRKAAAGTRRVSVTKKDSKQKIQVGVNTEGVALKQSTGSANAVITKPEVKARPAPVLSTLAEIAPAPAAVATAAAAAQNGTYMSDDSEFQSLAEAAVSGLVDKASRTTTCTASVPVEAATSTTNTDAEDSPEMDFMTSTNEKVDTSTEHIKALTSNNWVAACAGASIGVVTVQPVSNDKNRNRRQLTADERARQNRDRNREHARNTRLRKKAYVDELKRTLTELMSQRDAGELEKRQAAQRELEQREVRFRVIEEFLKLRGRNESNFARWAAILEDGFSLTSPISDLNEMLRGEVAPGFEQTIKGVSDVMADANAFSSFLQSMGSRPGNVTCQFDCDRPNFFMDGCDAVLEWTATSIGAVAKVCFHDENFLLLFRGNHLTFVNFLLLSQGSPAELILKGVIRGKFSPASNKLVSAKIAFDTGSAFLQLQKMACGTSEPAFEAAQADAILDSLCLPSGTVPSAVIVHSSSSSEGSMDKGEQISDDSDGEHMDWKIMGVAS